MVYQWAPTSLVPGASFTEDSFPMDQGQGGWFWGASSTLHLLYTLFLLLHQVQLRSSGIRSGRLGTPGLVHPYHDICGAVESCHLQDPRLFSSVQFSRVQLFATPWTAAHQASLSITNYQSLLKLMPIESVMPSSHLILCHPLLLLPPIPPSIRVFSNESSPRMRWPKYWSFSFSISSSNEHPGLFSFRMDWLDLLAVQGTLTFANTTVQKHQFFGAQLSLQSNSHIHTWPREKP